ncbi:MAG: hypothetical protein JW928_07660 [Candidatus Aureabacteria bacterium]|nr:hypothetical protein [Candidatus Auribacterota bacterium]
MNSLLKNKAGSHFDLLIVFSLCLAGFLVFFPVLQCGFVNFDDNRYIYENRDILHADKDAVVNFFSRCYVGLYLPLTMLSFALDFTLWRLSPAGFHAMNLFLHLCNVMLVFTILKRLLKDRRPAFFVCLLFAVHPVQVEVVAWVSQRKTLLSSFFILLSFLLYARSYESGEEGRRFYRFSLLCYMLSLLSKPAYVFYPFILIFYDYCFLKKTWRSALSGKTLFFLFSLMSGGITWYCHQSSGALYFYREGSFFKNAAVSLASLGLYARILIFPVRLSVIYELPREGHFFISFALGFILLVSGAFFAAAGLREKKESVFYLAWVFFIIVPVSGLLLPLSTVANDRYLYLPSVAFFVIFLQPLFTMRRPISRLKKFYMAGAGTALLLFYMFSAHSRIRIWENTEVLWIDTIAKTRLTHLPFLSLGHFYLEKGNLSAAEKHLDKALEKAPENIDTLITLSMLFFQKKDYASSMDYLKKAHAVEPTNADILNRMGIISAHQGRKDDSLLYFFQAIQNRPDYFDPYFNTAVVFFEQGEKEKAEDFFVLALHAGKDSSMIMQEHIDRYERMRQIELADFLESILQKNR